jgi:hypothetical protein
MLVTIEVMQQDLVNGWEYSLKDTNNTPVEDGKFFKQSELKEAD